MNLLIDNYGLVCVDELFDDRKQYDVMIGNLHYQGPDKIILVIHKGVVKSINIKQLGDSMEVMMIKHRARYMIAGDISSIKSDNIIASLQLNPSYNEETGEVNYILPGIKITDIHKINQQLVDLGLIGRVQQLASGICFVSQDVSSVDSLSAMSRDGGEFDQVLFELFVSRLVGYYVLYGTVQSKGSEVSSIRRQIPLVGNIQQKRSALKQSLDRASRQGMVLSYQLIEHGKYPIIQITTHDDELIVAIVSLTKHQSALEDNLQIRMSNDIIRYQQLICEYVTSQGGTSDVLDQSPAVWKLIKK